MRGGNHLKKNSTHLNIDTFMMDATTPLADWQQRRRQGQQQLRIN
jgi:hypothetical protein